MAWILQSHISERIGAELLVLLCVISQRWRETSAEKREQERLEFDTINEVRQAAEVHRQVLGL